MLISNLYCHDASQSLTLDLAEITQKCSRDLESSRHLCEIDDGLRLRDIPKDHLIAKHSSANEHTVVLHASKFERVWNL